MELLKEIWAEKHSGGFCRSVPYRLLLGYGNRFYRKTLEKCGKFFHKTR